MKDIIRTIGSSLSHMEPFEIDDSVKYLFFQKNYQTSCKPLL